MADFGDKVVFNHGADEPKNLGFVIGGGRDDADIVWYSRQNGWSVAKAVPYESSQDAANQSQAGHTYHAVGD